MSICRLTGRVLVEGSPREGAYLRVNGPSGDFVWEARTDAGGAFGFNLPAGKWTMVAFAPGTERAIRQVQLDESSSEVLINLSRP